MKNIIQISSITNFYGGIYVIIHKNKYYWGIKDYDGYNWEEITKKLYDELIKFNNLTKKNEKSQK